MRRQASGFTIDHISVDLVLDVDVVVDADVVAVVHLDAARAWDTRGRRLT